MKRQSSSESLIDLVAYTLVSAQVGCILFSKKFGFAKGYCNGRRSMARFILKQHTKDYQKLGRQRVAKSVREWCQYFRKDFAKQNNGCL